jgi:hypothetical protein
LRYFELPNGAVTGAVAYDLDHCCLHCIGTWGAG